MRGSRSGRVNIADMNLVWTGLEFELAFYQTCFILLFWQLSAFLCFGLLASGLLLCFDWSPNTGSARLGSKAQRDCETSREKVKRSLLHRPDLNPCPVSEKFVPKEIARQPFRH